MDSNTAGLIFNAAMMYRRYNRVLASTGDSRLANRAALHTFGLLWLAGWGIVGSLMFGFLCIFWVGFLVPLALCLLCIPIWLYALGRDRAWEASFSQAAIVPPPIPGYGLPSGR